MKYYECHVTIAPVFNDRLALLKDVANKHSFRVATLLMAKSMDEKIASTEDSFMTGRSKDASELTTRMRRLISDLKLHDYVVWRYKIEKTVFDSRYDDSFSLLDRDFLPDKELNPRPAV